MIDPVTNPARDRNVWRELDIKLRPFIARRVRSVTDVDDVIQDVFLRMQRALPELRDDESFGPWVYKVTRSAIANHHRAASRHPLAKEAMTSDEPFEERQVAVADADAEAEVAADAAAEAEADDDDVTAAERDLSAYVAMFVAMLPSPYREALTLTELEGLTQKEAAKMLGISLSGMKSRVQRGREHLRKALNECCKIALDARGRVLECEPRPNNRVPNCRC